MYCVYLFISIAMAAENPHDRFLFFGTAVPRDQMADHRKEKLKLGDLALYLPKNVLFDKMNKKRMYITADHGVAGVNAQGLPCIVQHPERVGEFLFDYEHRDTGNYDICGMLYGTDAGRAMARRMMHGKDDCLSLSHDTVLYTDPSTQQQFIGFSGNHVAVLNSKETPPGRDGCNIHHLVPLSKSNSLMNELRAMKIRRENNQLDRRIEELSRNLNSYLSKNPPVAETPSIVQSPPTTTTTTTAVSDMAEKAPEGASQAQAQADPATTITTTQESGGGAPEPTIAQLEEQHAAMNAEIQAIENDSERWFSSPEEYKAKITSEDAQERAIALQAVAEMAERKRRLSAIAVQMKDAKSREMQAKLDDYEKKMKEQQEMFKKQTDELKELSSHTLKGNFNEIMQTCGAEAGMTEERLAKMHNVFDIATSIGGEQGKALMDGLQIMTTSCSKLGRAAAASAAGRFGRGPTSATSGESLLSSVFERNTTGLPFSKTQLSQASSAGGKRPASEALPTQQDAAKKQASSDNGPAFFMPNFGSSSDMRSNPRQYESEDFASVTKDFFQKRVAAFKAANVQ